eukprot:363414-Chlamydomonas_euryale.AAC.2
MTGKLRPGAAETSASAPAPSRAASTAGGRTQQQHPRQPQGAQTRQRWTTVRRAGSCASGGTTGAAELIPRSPRPSARRWFPQTPPGRASRSSRGSTC